MPLDPKQLRRDAKRRQKARLQQKVGRTPTGATDAIRAVLPTIYQLRQEGLLWRTIAEAIGDQGVVQGKKRIPLTASRLTCLVRQIEVQEAKQARKSGKRDRSDAANQPAEPVRKLSLSPDLAPRPVASDGAPVLDEDELRRAAFEKLKTVFKKE
jgi:hypothetical protein